MKVQIERRYRGPDNSGNGGYSAGVVAAALGLPLGPAEITLHHPPPLDRDLAATADADGVTIGLHDVTIATGRPSALALDVPSPVSFAEAQDAGTRCPWLHDHPYPQCFVCGTDRPDGLRIFPGPVQGRRLAAATWVPDASVADGTAVRPAVVWASVDCPSLFGYGCFAPWDALMLLGRFTAHVHRAPLVGEPCVVSGWALGRDGRKHDTAAALHTAEGELLALSRALWITMKQDTEPLSAAEDRI